MLAKKKKKNLILKWKFPAFNYFQHAEEFALSADSSENIKKTKRR